MALLIKAEDLKGLLSPREIVELVEEGYRRWTQGEAYSHPRQSLQAGPTRLRVISGGYPTWGLLACASIVTTLREKIGSEIPRWRIGALRAGRWSCSKRREGD